jgi:hypothetical protein
MCSGVLTSVFFTLAHQSEDSQYHGGVSEGCYNTDYAYAQVTLLRCEPITFLKL